MKAQYDVSQVLIVSASGRRYGLPVRDVIEVLDNVAITPVPGVAPSVSGVVRYERGVVAVVPLARIVSVADSAAAGRATVVVIRSADAPVAIEVDDVFEVVEVTAGLRKDSNARWCLGTAECNGDMLEVVDARSIAVQLQHADAMVL